MQNSQHRFTIYFQDDAVYERSNKIAQELLASALGKPSSTSTVLAKKALKYRKVYERMDGVDVTAPAFDASEFLGVSWCKTKSLKAHCSGQQIADRV